MRNFQMLTLHTQCRLVHAASDQCAFVKGNCPDEEAGLLSYLQLYYCRLPNAKPVAFSIMVVWLGLLFSTIGIAASDFFCIDLSTIASILGMSESMAGVTFLAFGNGSPDVFSTFAAMKTHSGSLAIGELIGAAGFITAVVAGSMALVRPFKVAKKSFVRDVGFFIIAASFSMVFLADGHLNLWECAAMVGFYVFYVIIVVAWHYYLKRRSRQRILENAARSHFHVPGTDEVQEEPYQDEDDEEVASANRTPSRTISADDFANLERAGNSFPKSLDEELDADDEARDRYLAEISNNMRVSRPQRRGRRTLINPIRPSLVGALEFRAVLSSLQKSRNIQTTPINLRRYSDDPAFTLGRQNNFSSPASIADFNRHEVEDNTERSNALEANENWGPAYRMRAKSTNDASTSREDPQFLQKLSVPQIDLVDTTDPNETENAPHDQPQQEAHSRVDAGLSPDAIPPPFQNEFGYLATSPVALTPRDHSQYEAFLAPPGNRDQSSAGQTASPVLSGHGSVSPRSAARLIKPTTPRLEIPHSTGSSQRSSPASPFPAYHDDPNFASSPSRPASIHLPPPSIGPESAFAQKIYDGPSEKPFRWWPYSVLPSPQILTSTLFPTLYSWGDKNIWEKMLGVVAAPSVFLLAVTLPVVEVDREEEDEGMPLMPDSALQPGDDPRTPNGPPKVVALPPDSPSTAALAPNGTLSRPSIDIRNQSAASPSINVTSPPPQAPETPPQSQTPRRDEFGGPPLTPDSTPPSSIKDWNRWLVIVQIFTAPLFIILMIHANTNLNNPSALILPLLISLICSLAISAVLILSTDPERAPKYRYLLCFAGFAVSIAWISTIAGEVVGVLKALGIILNISDAILGLTIFAVGNSLGDLVADITVARLGYPVMALSACFGGPMLNILLGIGLSGLYMTIRGGEHRHEMHPGEPIRYKPYQIEVGGTLLISGVALLVTLLGLLIIVPVRGWWMDRKVGWGLVALWTISTVGNVVVEMIGVGKEK